MNNLLVRVTFTLPNKMMPAIKLCEYAHPRKYAYKLELCNDYFFLIAINQQLK